MGLLFSRYCLSVASFFEKGNRGFMNTIEDFNDSELWIIRTTLKERYRYGQNIEMQLADSELSLNPATPEITMCPTVYWEIEPVSFVIFKTAPERYRCQFFYSENEMYGTGIEEYDNIGDCVSTLLKMQADFEGKKSLQN